MENRFCFLILGPLKYSKKGNSVLFSKELSFLWHRIWEESRKKLVRLCGPEVINSRQLPVVVNTVGLKLRFFTPLIIIENCSKSQNLILSDAVKSYNSISPALWTQWPFISKQGGPGGSHSVSAAWILAWVGLCKHATTPLPKCGISIPEVSWVDSSKDPRHSTCRKE